MAAATTAAPRVTRPRIDSIDLLRGLVMIVMALDHTRDFFTASGLNPRDVADPALFLTRWVTHFCAPTFIFLAGISAFLYGGRGRTTGDVSVFLLTRGLWLIVLEFTLVRLAWRFSFDAGFFVAQVIFAIGAAMVVLSLLVHLPRAAIAAVGLVLIAGHNLLDGIRAEQFGAFSLLWNILHQPAIVPLGSGVRLGVLYPLVPWVGVTAAGYALGPVFTLDRASRTRWLAGLGAGVLVGFVVLRWSNVYGDPKAWTSHDTFFAIVLSFVDCEKYPPSLLYLAMTLGPALLLLALFERARGRLAGWITTYGRVPLVYYIAHLALIHALAVGFAWVTIGDVGWLFGGSPGQKPAGYGLALPGVYGVWLAVVVMLYPLCRRFAALKQQRAGWWWSYV